MNLQRFSLNRRSIRAGVVLAAAAALVVAASWRGSAAGRPAALAAPMQTVTSPLAHTVSGARDSYADVVEVVAPAVVTIQTERKGKMASAQFGGPNDDLMRRFFGEQGERRQGPPPQAFRQRALGSGVIVTADGYVLTNHHVIDGAEAIRVELTDGRTLNATLVGFDKPTDLALLRITATDLHPLALGNSDAVRVGDVVLAVGNPLGVGQTVTMGIVSAKGRATGPGNGAYQDFLQTDASINHGNSGGALVNTKGELVGINSQILSNSDGNIGIGFAIPSNMARNVMEQLRTGGRVVRAQLGVTVQGVTSEMAESLGLSQVGGAIVSGVAPGSAAERAGLKRGDVIRSFNGEAVHDTNGLRNRVAVAAPGSAANVVIVRDGVEQSVTVKLDEANGDAATTTARAGADDSTALGVAVTPLTPEVAARVGVPRDTRGVLVEEVDPDGRAAAAGIQPGDVIEEANRQPVRTVEELRAAVRRGADKPTLLLVKRQGQDVFITVRPSAK